MKPLYQAISTSLLADQPFAFDTQAKEPEPETSLNPNAVVTSDSSGMQWFVDEFSKPEYQWVVD